MPPQLLEASYAPVVVSYTQRPSSFKAIIKSIFNKLTFVNVGSLLLADSFAISFLKFTKSCKNASKNEIYLQEIINHQIKKCLLFRCRHAVVIMQTLNWTNHSVRYSWQSAIFLRSVRMTTHAQWATPAVIGEL
jgi:hypothetical protein